MTNLQLTPTSYLKMGVLERSFLNTTLLKIFMEQIAFKGFILSKGYRIPDILERLVLRKGWKYDSVKTPIHKVIKISQNGDDAREDV